MSEHSESSTDSADPCEYVQLPKLPLPPLHSTIAHLRDNLKWEFVAETLSDNQITSEANLKRRRICNR